MIKTTIKTFISKNQETYFVLNNKNKVYKYSYVNVVLLKDVCFCLVTYPETFS